MAKEYKVYEDNGDFIINPIANPLVYDFFILTDKVSPGICKISGASNPRKWDERKGQGTSGAGIVYAGDELAKFSITLTFWTPEDFQYWSEFKRLLEKPKSTQDPAALDIYHPFLDDLGINSVVCEDYTQFDEDGDAYKIVIKFKQYRAPKPASGKPLASKDAANKKGDTSANATPPTEGELILQGLLVQIKDEQNKGKPPIPPPAQPTAVVTGKI